MRSKRLLLSFLFVVIAGQAPARPRLPSQENDRPAWNRIEISSTKVSPSEIHTLRNPNGATVTVQVAILGKLPPDSVATVEVGTYSADPSTNNVSFSGKQTLPLKTSPTAYTFKVRPSEKTLSGSVIIASDIVSATRGINVINSMDTDPSVWRTELKIVDP